MFKRLLVTELQTNSKFLMASLAINIVLFVFLGYQGEEPYAFMGGSLLSFWVLLIVATSVSGHEKRGRLLVQLPVTLRQIFAAGWSFVLIWLLLQILAWVLYGFVFIDEFTTAEAVSVINVGLGAAVFLIIVAIGIDLGAYSPAYYQWLYIFFAAALLVLAISADMSFGFIANDDGFRFFPVALLENLPLEFALSAAMLIALLAIDYLVFQNCDNYLE